jgi:ABC-type lipoprotein release transport system permease subunit
VYRSFLAWRYLVARRTNLIGIVGIFVAVAALILIVSIMTGFLDESRKAIRGSLSDVMVNPIALERFDGRTPPQEPERLLAVLRTDERIAAISAQLVWGGMIAPEGGDLERASALFGSPTLADLPLVRLVGIDYADERNTSSLASSLERVDDPRARVADLDAPFEPPPEHVPEGRPKRGIVLGEQLMRQLGLRRGAPVNLATVVPDPATGEVRTSNRSFVVAGAFRSGENEMDLERVYLERAELADLLGTTRSFSDVLIKLHDYDRDGAAFAAQTAMALDWLGLTRGHLSEVRTWEQFRGSLLGAIENERTLMAIMLSLVLMVSGFTVFAILSMMVAEKRRDIGILCSLGATPRGILALFLLIGLWDALLGLVGGLTAGVLAARHIDAIERWLSSTFGFEIFDRSVYLFDHIPARVEPSAVIAIALAALVSTLVFAAWPAWRAGRTDPLEGLRYE